MPSPSSGAQHLASATMGHLTARAIAGAAVDQIATSAHERLVYRSQLAEELGLDVHVTDVEFEAGVRATAVQRAKERAAAIGSSGPFDSSVSMGNVFARAADEFSKREFQRAV